MVMNIRSNFLVFFFALKIIKFGKYHGANHDSKPFIYGNAIFQTDCISITLALRRTYLTGKR